MRGGIEGPPSETVSVTPIDTFPPAPPRGLRAVRTSNSVELSWLPVEEEDVAGYRVLRSGAALGPLVEGTAFSDSTATAGTPYEYEVTVVTQTATKAGQQSELRFPLSVRDFAKPALPYRQTRHAVPGLRANRSLQSGETDVRSASSK